APGKRAVAGALGPANFLPVRVVELRDLGVVVETARGDRVPVAGLGAHRVGDRGFLVLRPETLSMTEAAMARGPSIPGRIVLRVFEGSRHLYAIEIGAGAAVQAELPAAGEPRIFPLGDQAREKIPPKPATLTPDHDNEPAPPPAGRPRRPRHYMNAPRRAEIRGKV